MDNYRVTILLATFNRAHLIEETLNSIKSQTYTNWECIIVDDHSTDDTPKVISRLIAEDSRFSYFLKTGAYKKGLSGTRNYGLDLARIRNAKYIQFFDDDDIMHCEKLTKQVIPLIESENYDMTICKYEGFRNIKELNEIKIISEIKIESSNLAEDFLFNKIRINSAGPLFRFHLFEEERFDETIPYGEEKELFLRIFFKYKPNSLAINEHLFFYRHHPHSITSREDTKLEKIGAEIFIIQKIWTFLYHRKLLSNKTVAFFLKQVILRNYNKQFLQEISLYVSECSNLSFFNKIKFKAIILIHRIYIKVVFKSLLINFR